MKNFKEIHEFTEGLEIHYWIAGAIVIILSIIFSAIFSSSEVKADDVKPQLMVKDCQRSIIRELKVADSEEDFIRILSHSETAYYTCLQK